MCADDGSVPPGHVFDRWGSIFEEAGGKMGKTFKILDQQKQFLLDHGRFQNVTEQRYKMPIGPWSSDRKYKEIGRWHLLECSEGIEGWSMALLTRVMGVSTRQIGLLCSDEHFTDGSFPIPVVCSRSSSLPRRGKSCFQGPLDSQLLPCVSLPTSSNQWYLTLI